MSLNPAIVKSTMDEAIKARRQQLARRILELEHLIVEWKSTNSQSNPGAVFELREMKKELESARASYRALLPPQRKPGESASPDGREDSYK